MKPQTLSKPAFVVSAILLATLTAVACASSDEVGNGQATPETSPSNGNENNGPVTLPPSATKDGGAPTETKKDCTTFVCKADSECQAMCPAVAGGVACCDLKASRCWNSKTAACPKFDVPDADAPPMY